MLSIHSKYSQLPAELPLHSAGVDAGGHDTGQYGASVLGSSERFLKIKISMNKKGLLNKHLEFMKDIKVCVT